MQPIGGGVFDNGTEGSATCQAASRPQPEEPHGESAQPGAADAGLNEESSSKSSEPADGDIPSEPAKSSQSSQDNDSGNAENDAPFKGIPDLISPIPSLPQPIHFRLIHPCASQYGLHDQLLWLSGKEITLAP
jgi:hypothetical protein